MLILLSKLVHVLTTLVELAESKNFIISDLNLIIKSTSFLILLQVLLNKLIILVSQLVGSLVRSTQFASPLLILNGHATVATDDSL